MADIRDNRGTNNNQERNYANNHDGRVMTQMLQASKERAIWTSMMYTRTSMFAM